jgi:hypothetical protein
MRDLCVALRILHGGVPKVRLVRLSSRAVTSRNVNSLLIGCFVDRLLNGERRL